MNKEFCLFVLQQLSPQSYSYVGDLQSVVDLSVTKTVESLEATIRKYVKSKSEFESWGKDVDDIRFVVHQVRRKTTLVQSLDHRFA